jgi:hypothetical protein
MILHWWVVPVVVVLVGGVGALYLAVVRTGGMGDRTGGRTLVDKPDIEPNPHPKTVAWNYYHRD